MKNKFRNIVFALTTFFTISAANAQQSFVQSGKQYDVRLNQVWGFTTAGSVYLNISVKAKGIDGRTPLCYEYVVARPDNHYYKLDIKKEKTLSDDVWVKDDQWVFLDLDASVNTLNSLIVRVGGEEIEFSNVPIDWGTYDKVPNAFKAESFLPGASGYVASTPLDYDLSSRRVFAVGNTTTGEVAIVLVGDFGSNVLAIDEKGMCYNYNTSNYSIPDRLRPHREEKEIAGQTMLFISTYFNFDPSVKVIKYVRSFNLSSWWSWNNVPIQWVTPKRKTK